MTPPAGFTERFAKVNGMPMLLLSGEKAGGTFLIEQAKLVASDVRGQVVTGAGHSLMEEAPKTVIPLSPTSSADADWGQVLQSHTVAQS